MIRPCTQADFEAIWQIINDAAQAYQGVIPADRWHEPYISKVQLQREIDDGVRFWGFDSDDGLLGVMGVQDKGEVNLIRHAYVKTAHRRKGIGAQLLGFLESRCDKPILVGTWADARWAVSFYQKHGYRLLGTQEKNALLRKFWSIPPRQVETSVVLANAKWRGVGRP